MTQYNIELCKKKMIRLVLEQKDIAKRAGLSESAVSKFFRGEAVRVKTADAIAKVLGLTIDSIVIDEEPKRRKAS